MPENTDYYPYMDTTSKLESPNTNPEGYTMGDVLADPGLDRDGIFDNHPLGASGVDPRQVKSLIKKTSIGV